MRNRSIVRNLWLAGPLLAVAILAACAPFTSREASSGGAREVRRFQLPPEQAARCFGRNAEDNSSALASEVAVQRDGGAETIVRVKNGVTYATAQFRRAGSGSTGEIQLNVTTTGRRGDLVDALVKGC